MFWEIVVKVVVAVAVEVVKELSDGAN